MVQLSQTMAVQMEYKLKYHLLGKFINNKSKCYSKATHMIEKSLNLLFLKLNNKLTILN